MAIIDELREKCRKAWNTDITNYWDYREFESIVRKELIKAHEKIKELEAKIEIKDATIKYIEQYVPER